MTTTKQAIVTGGTRGIGKAICLELAKQGFDLAFTFRSREELARELEQEIAALGRKAKGYALDISNAEAIEAGAEQILSDFPSPDVLVNNAGVSIDGLVLRFKLEDFETLMNTNVRGAFLMTQAVSRSMLKARRGSIVFISSVIGQSGNAGQSAYSTTKAALLGMTKSLAKEFGPRNIRVNAVTPGFIQTDMTSALPASSKESILAQIPLGKFGSPEDVAKTVGFLTSPASQYITGQVIAVNGGLYM
jgi:3-oxoacyl-[acyl-carrier protein] reductase